MGGSVIRDECLCARTHLGPQGPGAHRAPPPLTALPPQDYELWESSDKTCRQLIYHLTPHSKRQQGSSLPRRKTQSW